MSEPWDRTGVVETYTGGGVDVFDPNPDDIALPDIAAGLAHTCRFGGHCRQFYSVAHHSLHVADELPAGNARLRAIGLLHDAAEAYLGDIPRPLKTELASFQGLEDQLLSAVWTAVGIDPPTDDEWDRVMDADDRLLAYEANAVLEGGGWAGPDPGLGYDLDSEPVDGIRRRYYERVETVLAEV